MCEAGMMLELPCMVLTDMSSSDCRPCLSHLHNKRWVGLEGMSFHPATHGKLPLHQLKMQHA
jgi:hypothetical protein